MKRLLLTAALLLSGCAATRPVEPQPKKLTSYTLERIEEGNTGDAIIRVGTVMNVN